MERQPKPASLPTGEGWSGRRGSNPRPTAWKAVTLPLSYSRLRSRSTPPRTTARQARPRAHPLRSLALRRARPLASPSPDATPTSSRPAPRRLTTPRRELPAARPQRACRPAKPASPASSSGAPTFPRTAQRKVGGEGRVRTSVARRRQVYSLLRLTTLPPPRITAPDQATTSGIRRRFARLMSEKLALHLH